MEAAGGFGLTRRQMLTTAGLAALVAATPALRRVSTSPLRSAPAPTAGAAPAWDLALSRFTPHVGSEFTVEGSGVRLRLEEATAWAPRPTDRSGLRGESFFLIMRAHGKTELGDGIHTLTHPALGRFSLFLVAVGAGRKGQGYQAVVDRRSPR